MFKKFMSSLTGFAKKPLVKIAKTAFSLLWIPAYFAVVPGNASATLTDSPSLLNKSAQTNAEQNKPNPRKKGKSHPRRSGEALEEYIANKIISETRVQKRDLEKIAQKKKAPVARIATQPKTKGKDIKLAFRKAISISNPHQVSDFFKRKTFQNAKIPENGRFMVRKRHPVSGKKNAAHWATDISVQRGTELYAPHAGKIAYTNVGEGKTPVVNYNNLIVTRILHATPIQKKGATASTNRVMAKVAPAGGLSDGDNVHIDVTIGGKRVDPTKINWLQLNHMMAGNPKLTLEEIQSCISDRPLHDNVLIATMLVGTENMGLAMAGWKPLPLVKQQGGEKTKVIAEKAAAPDQPTLKKRANLPSRAFWRKSGFNHRYG